MFGELERIIDEMIMAYFKVLTWHLTCGTDKNDKNLSQQFVAQKSNKMGTSQIESLKLTFPVYSQEP